MKRIVWIAGGAAAALVAGAYVGSPWYAMGELQKAAETGDRHALERMVDFPSVRDGLKAQIKSRMLTELAQDETAKDNPFAALGALVIPAMVDGVVEVMVTPENLSTLIREGTAAGIPAEKDPAPDKTPPGEKQDEAASKEASTTVDARYVSLDQFVIAVDDSDKPGAPVELTLERRGVFSWRLVDVTLPQDGPAT